MTFIEAIKQECGKFFHLMGCACQCRYDKANEGSVGVLVEVGFPANDPKVKSDFMIFETDADGTFDDRAKCTVRDMLLLMMKEAG